MPVRRPALPALLAAAVLASCEPVTHEASASFDPPLTRVVIWSDVGDVAVLGTPTQRVNVRQEVHGWRGALAASQEVRGEVLFVDLRCEGVLECHGHTFVELPAGLDVSIEVGDGDVSLDGLRGVVDLSVGQGEVLGERLSPRELALAVADGPVNLTLEASPEQLTVAVGRGDVTIAMPDEPTRVHVDTGDGAVRSELTGASALNGPRVDVSVARGDIVLLDS
ncbi:MAG: DUF4097 family beta strand repeat protein [Alphaproteobacteria bacterium]|nr:DUF4097 family beta strand repeat protein [Alphaproteobacteria bacterium]